MDAFFAQVEIRDNPDLRGRPVIVGGDGVRGVVASCSYEARWYGIHSAMASTKAKRLCPHAVFVRGRYEAYEQASRHMHEVFQSFTPIIEPLSLDEAFLDVSGAQRLFGPPEQIAWAIRRRLIDELGLYASVGVAATKHVAKLASSAAKPRPSRRGPVDGPGVVVVAQDEAIAFLHGLAVRSLWGVGPATAARLERLGVTTVSQLAHLPVERLVATLGPSLATHLHDLAWNMDFRSVEVDRPLKSVGHEQTFCSDLFDNKSVHDAFVRLADAVGMRLRHAGKIGRTVTVKVRFGNFETVTRSKTIPSGTANGLALARLAGELTCGLDVARGIRLLGLSVSNFEGTGDTEQLSLDDLVDDRDRGRANGDTGRNGSMTGSYNSADDRDSLLDGVIDRIRQRYGEAVMVPGALVAHREHL